MIRFQDLLVSDVMTADPITLPSDATLAEAEVLLLDKGLEAAPVVDDEGVYLGSCGMRLLLQARRDALPKARTVGCLELEREHVCTADLRLAQACQQMIRERAHRLVVVEGERPVGVVSSVEAARVLACLEDMGAQRPGSARQNRADPMIANEEGLA